jgi:5'-nucleotidase
MKTRYTLFLLWFLAVAASARTPLVILHTNDTHSQLEPFASEDGKNADKGGILRREYLIRLVRSEEPNVLVVEAGDFVQGTPYFNMFKGEAEVGLMNFLHLDAITLGNHEFDNGVEALADMLRKANFPVVVTNYDVSRTALKDLVKPWIIVRKGGLLIGIVGAGLNPEGSIMSTNFEGIIYHDPIQAVESRAAWLKEKMKCDIVVCLSHLGYESGKKEPDDLKMAGQTRHVDVIIGGHTHVYLDTPTLKKNLNGDTVIVNQIGKAGVYVGRLDLEIGK